MPNRRRHDRRVGAVAARHEPVAGPLEDDEPVDLLRDLGHELDGARPGADHGHALAAQVVVVVPPGGVEAVAGEAVEPFDPGVGLAVELAGGDDHRLALPAAPVGARRRPDAAVLVPAACGHLDVAGDAPVDPVLAGDVAQVFEDLGLRRAEPQPVAALRERVRVEVARDVAGRARIAVVEPGAAELGRPVEQGDVVEAVGLQLDAGADAAEPGPDDHYPWAAHDVNLFAAGQLSVAPFSRLHASQRSWRLPGALEPPSATGIT